MKQIPWFKRTFDFSSQENTFPALLERLEGTPIRLIHKLHSLGEIHLTRRMDDSWSIQENIGHLGDLEPLWHGRLKDILNGTEVMRSADLENLKTQHADHNTRPIGEVVGEFADHRMNLIANLRSLSLDQIELSALHPRLKTPMRIQDLFLFVAEHDDHHLARITEISNYLNAQKTA